MVDGSTSFFFTVNHSQWRYVCRDVGKSMTSCLVSWRSLIQHTNEKWILHSIHVLENRWTYRMNSSSSKGECTIIFHCWTIPSNIPINRRCTSKSRWQKGPIFTRYNWQLDDRYLAIYQPRNVTISLSTRRWWHIFHFSWIL